MAKVLQCDNCGNYFEYKRMKINTSIKTTDANSIAFCLSDGDGLRHIQSYDICPDCLKKLFTIMPGIIGGEGK